jgi:cytochrome P450
MSQSAKFDLPSSRAAFDLSDALFKAHPYPILAHLPTGNPLYLYASFPAEQNTWLIICHKDAETIFHDEHFVTDRRDALPPAEYVPLPDPSPSVDGLFGPDMLKCDPLEHTRLRKPVNPFVTARAIVQWRDSMQAISEELMDIVEGTGQMDFIAEFASPLPARIISQVLGVPSEESTKLHAWTKQRGVHLQAFYTSLPALIDQKRRTPGDDLVSKLIHTASNDDRLSEQELVAMIFLLIFAGLETTTHLIGNGMLALLTHPAPQPGPS